MTVVKGKTRSIGILSSDLFASVAQNTIFLLPPGKSPYLPTKGLPSWERCSRIVYTCQALGSMSVIADQMA